MSWALSPEQTAALQSLQRERDLQLLGEQLALAFPDVPGRLGERYPLLIALAAQRGAGHGLTHLAGLARYLACWVALGAEFETRPGFEWAATILAGGQPEGARVFQLCRGVREQLLARPLPGMPSAAAFDAALALLDAALQAAGGVGDLANLAEPPRGGERRRLKLGAACDLDALDLRRADSSERLRYALVDGQWQRQAVVPANPGATAALTLRQPLAEGAELPAQISVLCPPAGAGGGGARLRLRTLAAQCCEAHPWVSLADGGGPRDWRGAGAADLNWTVMAPPTAAAAVPASGLQPVIAAAASPVTSQLDIRSCGLRDSGAPLGDVHLQVNSYAAEQHLLVWRREPGPAVFLPAAAGQPVPAPPPTQLRLERDGAALGTAAWQAGFAELDQQLAQGLARLATAWERVSGVTQSRLQAEPRLLCGGAALTWGHAERPKGLLAAPFLRVAGLIDLVACQLNLRFSGTLAMAGSLSRLSLHCASAAPLKLSWEGQPGDADPLQGAAAAKVAFRQPFVLVLDSVAQDAVAVLNVGGAVGGALVGSCGLRPRTEGPGLQWFATLAIEAASVPLQLSDPLLGDQAWLHPLLPALKLVDWSL